MSDVPGNASAPSDAQGAESADAPEKRARTRRAPSWAASRAPVDPTRGSTFDLTPRLRVRRVGVRLPGRRARERMRDIRAKTGFRSHRSSKTGKTVPRCAPIASDASPAGAGVLVLVTSAARRPPAPRSADLSSERSARARSRDHGVDARRVQLCRHGARGPPAPPALFCFSFPRSSPERARC